MNRQIEEMAKVLSTVKRCNALAVSECIKNKCAYPHYEGVTCIAEHQAEALYNAGYRKASEVASEIFEAIYGISIGCSVENDVMRLTFEKDPYVLVVLASEFDKLRKKCESEGGE